MVGVIPEDSISAEMRLSLGQGEHQTVVGVPRGGSPAESAPEPRLLLVGWALEGLCTFLHLAQRPKTLILNS